jgi:hypothetical protein
MAPLPLPFHHETLILTISGLSMDNPLHRYRYIRLHGHSTGRHLPHVPLRLVPRHPPRRPNLHLLCAERPRDRRRLCPRSMDRCRGLAWHVHLYRMYQRRAERPSRPAYYLREKIEALGRAEVSRIRLEGRAGSQSRSPMKTCQMRM